MQGNQRLARLIDLVPFISSHQGIAIADLAKRFNVTVAEIEKDLWLLYCCGLPGQTPLELMEFAFEDGYVYVRNADELKQPRSLSQVELATLVMGLEIIASDGNETAKNLLERLKAKLATKIAVQPSHSDKYIFEIENAIQKNLIINISYKGKERNVIPYELYVEHGFTYMKGYCQTAQARRTFKLDRIESLALTDIKALIPNDVSSSSEKLSTSIKIHKEIRLVREILGLNIEDNHEKVIQEISFYSREWLIGEALALGGSIELIDPELRAELAKRAQAGKNLYLG